MSFYSAFLYLLPTLLVLCIVTILVCAKRRTWRQQRAPPALPVIGHLHLLRKLPHRALHQLSQSYGPLMSLRFGSLPILVASSPSMAKQILHTHDHAFSGRPRTAALHHITFGVSDIIFAQPDRSWRLKRQICATQLFSNKRLQALKWMREAEVGALLRSILAASGHITANLGHPIVVRPKLMDVSNNIISWMLLSKRMSEDGIKEESLISMLHEAVALVSAPNIGDYVPCLACMDLQGYIKRSKIVAEKLLLALQAIIDERRMHPMMVDEENYDLLQVLLSASTSLHVELTDKHIITVLMDMFVAGTDTTAYMVEWALAVLLCNPEKMKKAQAEIDGVVGKARRVQEDDIDKLPYMQAVVKEVMRLYPVGPLLIPHAASKACEILGFHIAEGTQVYVNVWAIGRDSEWWERPLEFMPERFLQDRHSGVDVRGLHFELLPFGSGRRRCPGLGLGLISVQTMLASLLHGFEWTTLSKPNMSETSGITMMMACPLAALTSPRLPPHCYTL